MSEAPPFPRPLPTPSRDSAFFWEGAARGELLGQRCDGCRRYRHPPRPMCPHCGSLRWRALPLSGLGRVHAWIRPVHPPLPMFEPGLIVALIDLDEGLRLLSNLRGAAPEEVATGLRVEVFFETVAPGVALPLFRPHRQDGRPRREAAGG